MPWSRPATGRSLPTYRGFGDSDKPEAVDAYGMLDLAADITGVIDHLAIERVHVVGHDWGAALGWALATFAPDRVASLAALSVGHPKAFRDAGLAQREKSWYMLLFQFEGCRRAVVEQRRVRQLQAMDDTPGRRRGRQSAVRPAALPPAWRSTAPTCHRSGW